MTDKQKIGRLGEDAACEYLRSKGYRVIQKNFLCKTGEIDVICIKDGCTVFVEVKTRKNSNYGTAAEFVDYRKQQKIKRAAMYYIKNADADMRFDVVEVYHNNGVVVEINHIENAF
ncbi:MAG: YraN family protein [Clostridia bacterium]|nr:YraN family protein [Clostridia bacterium]